VTHEHHHNEGEAGRACDECPAAAASRRVFLRNVALTVAGALALTASGAPAALAKSVLETKPSRSRGMRRTYGLPVQDAISIDVDNDVILARWQNHVYAFSLKCPHRGTQLEWHADERRVFCPKHKARFTAEGLYDSGRRTRDLDRYDIARQGSTVEVDLGALRRADQEPDEWRRAVITLS
jgi:nitrite reductase/ring-hydroxylating ferredoxin subunit